MQRQSHGGGAQGGVRAYSGLQLQCATTLVTMAQVSATGFDLLSQVVVVGGVLGAFVSV
jgi:hypothetical protein